MIIVKENVGDHLSPSRRTLTPSENSLPSAIFAHAEMGIYFILKNLFLLYSWFNLVSYRVSDLAFYHSFDGSLHLLLFFPFSRPSGVICIHLEQCGAVEQASVNNFTATDIRHASKISILQRLVRRKGCKVSLPFVLDGIGFAKIVNSAS